MMSKIQRITISGIIIVGTYIVPLYVFNQNQNNYSNIEMIQRIVFSVLFLGSIILIFLNHKNRLAVKELRWLWILLETIGILGAIYSGFILYLLFAFRYGIGL